MKRGTPRNPKVLHLANILKVKIPTAVGYLELLWHFTAEFAPQGDIGRFDDRWIEAALFWTGRHGHLIHCLTVARWLDRHSEYRLTVHDWHEHADDAVRKRITRLGLQFLSVNGKVTRQSTVSDRTTANVGEGHVCLPEPEPSQSLASAAAARTNGAPMPPLQTQSEYPLTKAEIRKHEAAIDDTFVRGLVAKTIQHCISSKEFPPEKLEKITDKNIARMCKESYATGPPDHRAGLLLVRVPAIAVSWAQERKET